MLWNYLKKIGLNINKMKYGKEYYEMMYNKQKDNAELISNIRWKFVEELNFKCVLDYGCGCNFLSKYVPKNIVIDSYDIINSSNAEIQPTGIKHEFYDLTFFNDILEHVDWKNSPDKKIEDILKRTKYVYVTIPILPFKKNFKNWIHNRPDEHLTLFTINSLDKFFKDKEFKKIKDGYPETIIREDIYSAIYEKIK